MSGVMTGTAQFSKVSRRRVLGGALATGFVFAFRLPVGAAKASQPKDPTDGKFAPNAYIRIDSSGQVTLVMPQVEMGQGIYTGVATILAEELDADLAQVVL
jgi:isoquinoline 1-oxidoreductase beta subunit